MERFRPNLVVSGVEAFAEDTWRQVRISTQLVAPSVRQGRRTAGVIRSRRPLIISRRRTTGGRLPLACTCTARARGGCDWGRRSGGSRRVRRGGRLAIWGRATAQARRGHARGISTSRCLNRGDRRTSVGACEVLRNHLASMKSDQGAEGECGFRSGSRGRDLAKTDRRSMAINAALGAMKPGCWKIW